MSSSTRSAKGGSCSKDDSEEEDEDDEEEDEDEEDEDEVWVSSACDWTIICLSNSLTEIAEETTGARPRPSSRGSGWIAKTSAKTAAFPKREDDEDREDNDEDDEDEGEDSLIWDPSWASRDSGPFGSSFSTLS